MHAPSTGQVVDQNDTHNLSNYNCEFMQEGNTYHIFDQAHLLKGYQILPLQMDKKKSPLLSHLTSEEETRQNWHLDLVVLHLSPFLLSNTAKHSMDFVYEHMNIHLFQEDPWGEHILKRK